MSVYPLINEGSTYPQNAGTPSVPPLWATRTSPLVAAEGQVAQEARRVGAATTVATIAASKIDTRRMEFMIDTGCRELLSCNEAGGDFIWRLTFIRCQLSGTLPAQGKDQGTRLETGSRSLVGIFTQGETVIVDCSTAGARNVSIG